MYRGFKLEGGAFDDFGHKSAGEDLVAKSKREMLPLLEEYVLRDGALDGTLIQEKWFPSVKADIFLSHSHADEDAAISLAGWLYDAFGLTTLYDSSIWGHADVLQQIIDNKYCRNTNNSNYNYTRRNHATAHVHMMLNTALTKMVDRCECLFFLKTPSSTVRSMINDINKTSSPWIYSELSTSQLIRKKVPKRLNRTELVKSFSAGGMVNEQLRIEYQIELDHLETLTATNLWLWSLTGNKLPLDDNEDHPLDGLYKLKPVKKKK